MSDRTPKALQRKLEEAGFKRVKDPSRTKKEKHSKWKHPRLDEYIVLSIGGRKDVSPAIYHKVRSSIEAAKNA